MRTRLIGMLAAGTAALVLPVAAQATGATAMTYHHPAAAARHGHPVAAARRATAKFHSIAVARKAGYARFKDVNGIACIAMPGMGAMGVHYVNGALVGNPAVLLTHPEALVYAPARGHLRLAALEYIVLKSAWDKVHGKNAPRPRKYGHRFNLTGAPNRYGLPAFYSLHAWIWKHNPAGQFAMWNPAVHCPAVATARLATAKFHSIAVARKAGYARFKDVNGIACIAMPPMGAMGVHYVNGTLVGNPAVLLTHPEALVYAPQNGHLRLAALEYIVLKSAWDKVHGKNAPRPRKYGHRFNITRAPNRYGLPTFYSLHAWIWKNNPAGQFAMWNPAVHCPI
jgi:hypothetical protein